MSEIPAVISAFANSVTAIAAVVAAGAAYFGLNTWKSQVSYQTDHRLATDILKLLYKHRDAVEAARHPAILGAEIAAAVEGKDQPEDADYASKRFSEIFAVYEKRWEKISEVRSDLYPLLLEADAVWNIDSRELFSPVFDLEWELKLVLEDYLKASNPSLSRAEKIVAQDSFSDKRYFLYGRLDSDDKFRSDYNSAMIPIENFLRKKLK